MWYGRGVACKWVLKEVALFALLRCQWPYFLEERNSLQKPGAQPIIVSGLAGES